jgi:signal-transduction protein with cAMP-binding, CBS, and nucleotidyltransferase domain
MTIDCEMTMVAGFLKMQQNNIRHLGITERGKIIGVISIKDIANYYVNKFRPNN